MINSSVLEWACSAKKNPKMSDQEKCFVDFLLHGCSIEKRERVEGVCVSGGAGEVGVEAHKKGRAGIEEFPRME